MSIPSHQAPRANRRMKNRLKAILCHIPRYSCRGLDRLAADSGVSRYSLKRFMEGAQPDYGLLTKVSEALNRELGYALDVREIAVFTHEAFQTPCPCALFGCACIPPWGYTRSGTLKPEFEGIPPGSWTFEVPQAHFLST